MSKKKNELFSAYPNLNDTVFKYYYRQREKAFDALDKNLVSDLSKNTQFI